MHQPYERGHLRDLLFAVAAILKLSIDSAEQITWSIYPGEKLV